MSRGTTACIFAAGLLGLAGVAYGHRGGHVHGGPHTRVFIGGTFFVPFYYPPPFYAPYYYYSPPATQYVEPYQYVQPYPLPAQPSYWYYCPESAAYYPYVLDCPGGWTRALPQPPS